jgi:cytochrome c-type biogenesis protein
MPTMLEFVAAACPICQRMHSVVVAAERDCSQHGIRVRQVDVSTTVGREAAAKNGVLGVPTFLFLDGAGKEVARLVGEQPLPVLIQSLEVLAGEKCDGFSPMTIPPAPGS